MPTTPPAAFQYKQYLQTPTQTISWATGAPFNTYGPPTQLQLLNVPQWLTYSNLLYNNGEVSVELGVNEQYAFNLAEGLYNAGVILKFKFPTIFGSLATATVTPYNVTLEVQHTTLLSLSPTNLSFGQYIIGGSLPQNLTLQIQSESNWTITSQQSWVTLSQTNGQASANVFVGVDPSGLTVGSYQSLLQVQDNLFTKTATVTLIVTEGDTDTNFLYISQTSMQFVSELGEPNTTVKNLNLESSHNWTAQISEPWLQLSQTSGAAGNFDLQVTVDSVNLTNTNQSYLATVVFTGNNIQKTLYVELILVEFLVQGLESGGLYFADDYNRLLVTDVTNNAYLRLEGLISSSETSQTYKLERPFLNGVSNPLVGLETNLLLKSVDPTNNFTTRVKNNFSPVLINFATYIINKFSNTSSLVETFNNLRFLKGKTPTNNIVCHVPGHIHVSKDAVLSLSQIAESGLNTIVVSGDIEANLNTVIATDLLVYNAIINLRDLGAEVGQNLVVAFGNISVNVTIVDTPFERRTIAFENEWNEFEFFECRGAVTEVATAINKKLSKQQVNDITIQSVVDLDIQKEYTINTGWIYSQNEVNWLAKILKAKKIYIYEDTEPIEILLSTKKLELYKTRDFLRSFNLKFKKAKV